MEHQHNLLDVMNYVLQDQESIESISLLPCVFPLNSLLIIYKDIVTYHRERERDKLTLCRLKHLPASHRYQQTEDNA